MSTKLLERFQGLFDGVEYHHRRSTLGDQVAQYLYEDLYELAQAAKYLDRVSEGEAVLNAKNTTHGVQHRRGDGSFGTLIPGEDPVWDSGFNVARGPIATIQIGAEVKIISKAMIRQIDRVMNDLRGQVKQFKKSNPQVISIGIVGVNHADQYRSIEGEREYVTTGKGKHKHPAQEASKAVGRLEEIRDVFDEFLIFKFKATNMGDLPFEWVSDRDVTRDYSSSLVRMSSAYEHRF